MYVHSCICEIQMYLSWLKRCIVSAYKLLYKAQSEKPKKICLKEKSLEIVSLSEFVCVYVCVCMLRYQQQIQQRSSIELELYL